MVVLLLVTLVAQASIQAEEAHRDAVGAAIGRAAIGRGVRHEMLSSGS